MIAEREKVSTEPEALHIIAQKADGALRDALSIFDQAVAFSNHQLTYQAVISNLNILDYDYYFKMTQALHEENISEALLIFNEILKAGFDGHIFIVGLGDHLRNLMVCADEATLSLMEVSDDLKARYREQAQQPSLMWLIQAMEVCNKADQSYKISKNQRLLIELSLMQIGSLAAQIAQKKKPVA